MNKLPSLEDIRVFTTAARLVSFGKAADQLGVSPAYISKRIKLLEENLGVALFFRTARSVQLTAEGEIALESGEQMLSLAENLHSRLMESRQETRGLLRIGCSTGFGTRFINPFILSLRDKFPLLNIDLVLMDRPIDLVTEKMDLDIRIGGTFPPQYIARKLAGNHRVFCASPEYVQQHGAPQHPAELENTHVCICIRERDHHHGHWRIENSQTVETIAPNAQLTVNNGSVAKSWCLDGGGILLRSVWDVKEEIESGRLVQVLPDWYQTADVYAVYSRKTETNANLRTFLEHFEAYIQSQAVSAGNH